MQVAGRDATGRDADVSVTVVSTGAAAARVTVSWLLEPPFTDVGKRVTFDTSMGVIWMPCVVAPPFRDAVT